MKAIIKNITLAASVVVTALSVTSCKDDDFVAPVADRLFSPVNLTAVVDGDDVAFSWNSVENAVGYTLEVAADSSFTEIAAVFNITETSANINTLDFENSYVPRVKARSLDAAKDSKYTIGAKFTTANSPIIINRPSNIGRDYVELDWNTEYDVDNIRLTVIGEENSEFYAISADEATAGIKVVEGLNPETSYSATIMYNGKGYNTVTFRTKAAIAAGAIEVPAGANLAEYLDNAPSGSVMILEGGAVYEFADSYQITKDVTIMSEGSVKPVLKVKEINVVGIVGTVRFENVEIDGNYTATSQGAYFIKFISTDKEDGFISLENLELVNVVAHDFANALIRKEDANNGVGKLLIDDCIIYNFGEGSSSYSLIHFKDGAFIADYEITNSTFYNFANGFIAQPYLQTAQSGYTQSLVVKNCTFNDFGKGQYLFNFKYQSGGSASMTDCILGQVKDKSAFRGNQGLSLTLTNVYATSDYGTGGSSISTTNTKVEAKELFTDPVNGNFKVTVEKYSMYGDLRWLK